MSCPRLWVCFVLMVLLLAACNTLYPETCPVSTPVGLLEADTIVRDESLPFRFPLDESPGDSTLFFGWFGVSNECPPDAEDCFNYPVREYHAAEDYQRPAGTPVYAMADGHVSFSGTAGGYGWLTIIDHPQANLYSLYGHLSPSRWKLASGTEVKKRDLIAYLGDPDENGGSVENPLEPHLHFGVRAGQTADYPGRGEWRFMAGWIKPCPQDLGWLQPSAVITSQTIPVSGYKAPEVEFLQRWGVELLITGSYTLGGLGMLIFAVKKHKLFFLFTPPGLVIAAGFVLHNKRILNTYTLLVIGVLMMTFVIYRNIRIFSAKLLNQMV
ncbi:MAG TPA: M23 family metallopeptidase [Anaerolineales bacterium]|nr:M23 family metallopeptidase [Anaerolineales bacterium]